MKTKHALLLSAFLAPTLLAFVPRADKVAFRPEKGSSLAKTFSVKQEFSMDEMNLKVNGQDQAAPEMEMTMSMHTSLAVNDTYDDLGDGRPAKLTRTYDKIGGQGSFKLHAAVIGDKDKDMKLASELEGKKVVFTWDKEKGDYTRAFAQDGDKALLEDVHEDLDLRAFLPTKEVAEQDTWDIKPEELRIVLSPASDLKMKPQDEESMKSMGQMGMDSADMAKVFADLGEGSIKAEYQGTRDVEGTKVGVIHVRVKVSGSHDSTEDAKKQLSKAPEGTPKPSIDHVDVTVKIEAEGELLWDLKAGHARSFKLDGSIKLDQDSAMNMDMGGGKMAIDTNFVMSGPFNAAIEFTKG